MSIRGYPATRIGLVADRGCGFSVVASRPPADAVGRSIVESRGAMDARTLDHAAKHLDELGVEIKEDLAVAALALALSLLATEFRPALAIPLFVGGVGVAALGMRALWRRWDLVDRLAADRDAYVIREVRAYAYREASHQSRHGLAMSIRGGLDSPVTAYWSRDEVADDLEALATELDDESLELDPAAAVACVRLLRDPEASPLLTGARPEEIRASIRHVRAGFSPRGSSSA